jgi:hypothetical protein
VLEALAVAVALCVLLQALSVRIRLITIVTKTNFFIFISFQSVRAFSSDEILSALIFYKISNGCLDFV